MCTSGSFTQGNSPASHHCLARIMFRFKVSGLLACGFCIFGNVFCCCGLFSSSFFWDLQKGQSGPQPHFSWSLTLSSSSLIGGLGLVTPGHDFRFILNFIVIIIVQIVWWEQPVSIFKQCSLTPCLHRPQGALCKLELVCCLIHHSWV